jgi:hypothetical protein
MTFQEALDLREDAFVGMSLDALRELREADRVIDRVAEERFARWQHEQAMLTRPLALVVGVSDDEQVPKWLRRRLVETEAQK